MWFEQHGPKMNLFWVDKSVHLTINFLRTVQVKQMKRLIIFNSFRHSKKSTGPVLTQHMANKYFGQSEVRALPM